MQMTNGMVFNPLSDNHQLISRYCYSPLYSKYDQLEACEIQTAVYEVSVFRRLYSLRSECLRNNLLYD